MQRRYVISLLDEAGKMRTFVVAPTGCEGDRLIAVRHGVREQYALADIEEWCLVDEGPKVDASRIDALPAIEPSVFDLCF